MASTTLAQQNVQDLAIESDIAQSSRPSVDDPPSFVYLHATCRNCHHWYNKHKIPSPFPRGQIFDLECPKCHKKLFRVGTQSSQDTFMTEETGVPESRPPSVSAIERVISGESSQLSTRIRRPRLILDTSSTQSSQVSLPGSRPQSIDLSATERILSGESSHVPNPIRHPELILDTSTLQSEPAVQSDSEPSTPRTPEDSNDVERSNDTLTTSASGSHVLQIGSEAHVTGQIDIVPTVSPLQKSRSSNRSLLRVDKKQPITERDPHKKLTSKTFDQEANLQPASQLIDNVSTSLGSTPHDSQTVGAQTSQKEFKKRTRRLMARYTKAFSKLQKIPLIWHFKSRPNGNSGGKPRGRAPIGLENRTGNVSHQTNKSEPWERNKPPSEEEDDDQPKRRRLTQEFPPSNPSGQLFACPFHKFDPRTFANNDTTGSKYRVCAGPGFKSVARVKEHLYRRHRAPILCRRCWMEFEDYGDLDEHLEKIAPCSPKESTAANSYEIGISRRTMEKLKSKRRSGEEQTEIDRWREVYKLLFPERIIIPTPFYDFDMSFVRPASSNSTDRRRITEFQEFLQHNLHLMLETGLQNVFDESSLSINGNRRLELAGVVQDSLRKAFTEWEQKESAPHKSTLTRTQDHQTERSVTQLSPSFNRDRSEAQKAGCQATISQNRHNGTSQQPISTEPVQTTNQVEGPAPGNVMPFDWDPNEWNFLRNSQTTIQTPEPHPTGFDSFPALNNDFRDDDFMREMMHLGQEAKNPGNVPPTGDPIIFDQLWGTLDAECI